MKIGCIPRASCRATCSRSERDKEVVSNTKIEHDDQIDRSADPKTKNTAKGTRRTRGATWIYLGLLAVRERNVIGSYLSQTRYKGREEESNWVGELTSLNQRHVEIGNLVVKRQVP